MATYNDFLGVGGTGVNVGRPVDPENDPNPNNPGGISNNELRQRQATITQSADTAAPWRARQITSGAKQATTPPGQWGQFDYARQGTPEKFSYNMPNELGADLARLGLAGARTIYGTGIGTVANAVLPDEAAAVISPLEYGVRAGADEAGDQLIPGGSGVYGSPIIPGTGSKTGGDLMYPSETIGNGYTEGYRGRGNPRVQVGPAGGGGAGGPSAGAPGGGLDPGIGTGLGGGGAYSPVAGPDRPDSYRSDAISPQIQGLLDAERRQGPSQAEALLTKATDRIAAQSLGIAAGARGGAGARERAGTVAASTNAAMGAQASSDIAALRAREDADSRARQQGIMALMQNNAEAGDQRDLGYYTSDQGRASSADNLHANIASNERISQAEIMNRAYQAEEERRARAFESEQTRALTRDQYNAGVKPGLFEDPFGWLTEAYTGRDIRGGNKI